MISKNQKHHLNPLSFSVSKDLIFLGHLVKGYDSAMKRAATASLTSLEKSPSPSHQHAGSQSSSVTQVCAKQQYQWSQKTKQMAVMVAAKQK